MDLDAVLARRPEVALVDELAHTNIPGSRNAKRWQDVEELLAAGITVISTVNIQHLESVNDVVEKITGVPQRETVPDAVVRAAEQVEMVDMTPEALRRRMAHGNVYAAVKVDAALSNYFRVGNLTALRELALLWVADRVEEGLLRYRAEHGIGQTWEARERVVVALTGGPEGATLIRRAARIASRTVGGDLLAVHVVRSDGLTGASPAALATQRRLAESLGGSYHQVIGDDISEALLAFARAENATQLVLGASRRSWLATMLTGPGIAAKTIQGSGDIDVHIVTHAEMGRRSGLPPAARSISLSRRIYGFALAAAAPPLIAIALASARGGLNLLSDALVFLVLVVLVALVGGLYPALLAAVATSLLLNYYFIPPLHTFTIQQPNNVLAPGRVRGGGRRGQRRGRPRRAAHPAGGARQRPIRDPRHPGRQRPARPVRRRRAARAGPRVIRHDLRNAAATDGWSTRGRLPRTGLHLGDRGIGRARAAGPAGRRRR